MKTYFTDIIPKIQKFSKKLDDLTLLTNKHWVVVDEASTEKNVYIFRENNQLLISQNGKVEKAKWEYLGNNSLLIDKTSTSYLFKHGFFNENILALKIDGKGEYAFLVNENKYKGELNSIENINNFLIAKYIEPELKKKEVDRSNFKTRKLITEKGELEIFTQQKIEYTTGDEVFLNGRPAPDGKYKYGWPSWLFSVEVKNGKLI